MIVKIISGILILFTAFMSFKHGYQGLTAKAGDTGPEAELFAKINLSMEAIKVISALTLLSALLILIPQTFVFGNLLNAGMILVLLLLFLKAGETKAALIEVPFLLIPLLLIWLKYPLG
jgi:hypothetical protein